MIPTIFHPAGSRRRLPPFSILSIRCGLMLGLSGAEEAAARSSAHRRNIAIPLHPSPILMGMAEGNPWDNNRQQGTGY
ncbi:MAG: hypothetical protein Q4G37_06275, partial [Bifidobacterium sp.]|nr:hypothetical protein [Bifidobacterium sp.]